MQAMKLDATLQFHTGSSNGISMRYVCYHILSILADQIVSSIRTCERFYRKVSSKPIIDASLNFFFFASDRCTKAHQTTVANKPGAE